MRTTITQAQLTAIVAQAFDGINFLQYQVTPDGTLEGAIVDHPYEAKLPDASGFE